MAFGQPASKAAIAAAFIWFLEEKYTPIRAQAGKYSINYPIPYGENLEKEFEKESFNRNLPYASFLDAYFVKKSIRDKYKTIENIPENAIIATLGGTKMQGLIFVCFETAKTFTLFSV